MHERQHVVDIFNLSSVDANAELEGATGQVEHSRPLPAAKVVDSYWISSDSESNADEMDDEAFEKEIEEEASQDHLTQKIAQEALQAHGALHVYDVSDFSGNRGQQFQSQGIY